MRYAAFISYNHRDRVHAAWLHRSIETYAIPRALQGRDTPLGPLGKKLPPVFQDREELAASADLASSVRQALESSASLIVICSPDGARSRWVNEEIRSFIALGRRAQIQCLIVGGQPNASGTPGADPELECLPPALFEHGGAEPLAADIRPGQDSRPAARLKLIAGVLDVRYDELRQREQARRNRRLVWLASASFAGFVVAAVLATVALISRAEAIAQREVARKKTVTAERTVDFIRSIFEVADPSESRGQTITAREILDLGSARIDRELAREPSIRADLGTTLGETYTGLGLLRHGEASIRRMLTDPGVDLGTRTRQYVALGAVLEAKADDAGALNAYKRALALARNPAAGRADLVPRSLVGMGVAESMLGEAAVGERHIRAALALDRARGAEAALDTARGLEALGYNRLNAGELPAARTSFEQALALRLKRQGALQPATIQLMNQVGSVAYLQGDSGTAERYFARVLPLREAVLGRQHPEIATSLNNYARLLIERADYATAAPLLRRAVAIQLAERGDRGADLAFLYANLGIALEGVRRSEEAQSYLAQGLAVATAKHHRNEAPTLGELATLACARGEVPVGLQLLARARPIMAKAYPMDAWRSAWLDAVEASCLEFSGHNQQAQIMRTRATPAILAKWSPKSHFGAILNVRKSQQAIGN